jgi:hypothetical protein
MMETFRNFLIRHPWVARAYALFAAVTFVPVAVVVILWRQRTDITDEYREILKVLLTGRMPR